MKKAIKNFFIVFLVFSVGYGIAVVLLMTFKFLTGITLL